MTPEEARALLGVEADASPDVIRRAYTRAVKKHKPESDPDGFRRVRDAFELLSRFGPFGADPIELGRDAPTVQEVPAAAVEAALALDSALAAPSDGAPRSTPARDDPLEPYRVRIDAAQSDDAATAVAEEALAAFPDSAQARWMLLDHLLVVDARARAAEIAREGERLGHPGFREVLFDELLDHVGFEELRDQLPRLPLHVMPTVLERWLASGHVDEAAEAAVMLAESAETGEGQLDLGRAARLGLRLVALDRLDEARRVSAGMKAFDVHRGPRAVALGAWNATAWLALDELLANASALDALDPAVRRAMARDILDDVSGNRESGVRLWANRRPFIARRLLRRLEKHAPTLHALFRLALPRPAAPSPGTSSSDAPLVPHWLWIGLMVAVARLVPMMADCRNDYSVERALLAALDAGSRTRAAQAAIPVRECCTDARQAVDVLCGTSDGPTCAAAYRFLHDTTTARCADARIELERITRAIADEPADGRGRRARDVLETTAHAACPREER